ncbi:MAG TPA: oligosaccharide flippase family protein [Tepidisphaeraceae bacterium]|nr:oligosaccharide flippase family protein [Tepidisphaeraceae bacterium]
MTDPHSVRPTGVEGELVVDPAIQHPLGGIAASGFRWNFAVTLGSKLVGFVSQLVLARLLLPEQFGAYAEATIVMSFAVILRDAVLPQILISRQRELEGWINPAFWISLMLGFASALIMAVAAVVWQLRSNGSLVAGLLWMAALGSPFIAAGVVPTVILQVRLRFKLIAKIAAQMVLLNTALSIGMAMLHCGAYSLMVPQVVTAVLRACILFYLASPKIRWRMQFAKWIGLAQDSGMMILSSLGLVVVGQGDYIILTARYDKAIVGFYFFAFNLSLQIINLTSSSLAGVLSPTLARLNLERERQVGAYLRACKILAAIGAPICTLQILLARFAIVAIFGVRWADSVPLLQILSAGMAFALVNSFAGSVLQTQGRFRTQALWTIVSTTAFVVLLRTGTGLFGVAGTAMAVSAYHILVGSVGMRLVVGRGGSWRQITWVFAPTVMACAVASLPILALPQFLPNIYHDNTSPLLVLAVIGGCASLFAFCYVICVRLFAKDIYLEVLSQFRHVAGVFGRFAKLLFIFESPST